MTLKSDRTWNCSSSSYSGQSSRKNSTSAVALKRYLDLTLRGTRQGPSDSLIKGQKNSTVSEYSFNYPKSGSPDAAKPVVLGNSDSQEFKQDAKPPNWVNETNSRVVNHRGEATIFAENFLSSHKNEQAVSSPSKQQRPLSGVSTKSAPVIINGAMYHRPMKTHSYLQASRRPASAIQDRMTRAANLRKNHQSKALTGNPSDSTKDDLKRMKSTKPVRHELDKDLMPIPCHNNESPHSFIVGARYNCSNFMDSRSFSRLGLYVPRSNPHRTFLKIYKEDSSLHSTTEQEIPEKTSVRTGGSARKKRVNVQPLGDRNGRAPVTKSSQSPFGDCHIRKVFKEVWLTGSGENNNRFMPSRSSSRSPVPPHPSPKPRLQTTRSFGSQRTLPRSRASSKQSKGSSRRPLTTTPTPAFASEDRLQRAVIAAENEGSNKEMFRRTASSGSVLELD